jgi:hypothetical protein
MVNGRLEELRNLASSIQRQSHPRLHAQQQAARFLSFMANTPAEG